MGYCRWISLIQKKKQYRNTQKQMPWDQSTFVNFFKQKEKRKTGPYIAVPLTMLVKGLQFIRNKRVLLLQITLKMTLCPESWISGLRDEDVCFYAPS